MVLLLAFALTLVAAVLVSELAHRSVLSTAVLFLVAGFVLGGGVTGILSFHPRDPAVFHLVEVALFAVLFSDGMRVGVRDLADAAHLPGRALLLGLPLTLLLTAGLAHVVAGLPWIASLLLGAALSPTDPVLVSAIVGREEVPQPLRRLLNVESGLNDALALPLVVLLLSYAAHQSPHVLDLAAELGLGLAIGIGVPLAFWALERIPVLAVATKYEALDVFAIGLVVLSLGLTSHANLFLAAFAAGVTIATVLPSKRAGFREFGEALTELLKLAALFVFGSLVSPGLLAEIGLAGYAFAALALLAVRPLALAVALARSPLDGRERAVAAWFGPRGFASVVFALLILRERLPLSDELFHLAAVVIAGSVMAHSSTDVAVARRFREEERGGRRGA